MGLTSEQEALLKELGMLDVVKKKVEKHRAKVLPPAKHNKIPAKPYNLRFNHHCRLCGAEWKEDIRMVPSHDDPSILVASEPIEDEEFVPDHMEDRFPRSCIFCRERLKKLTPDQLATAAMTLSNRITDSKKAQPRAFVDIEDYYID